MVGLNRNEILLRNDSGQRRFVALLPLRDVTFVELNKYVELIELINRSFFQVVVMIIKFHDRILIDKLVSSFSSEIELHILFRPTDESIFDSQKLVQLDLNMWIMQIHEDDRVKFLSDEVPGLMDEYDVGCPKINHLYPNLEEVDQPNRHVFSLIPSLVWNRFTGFLNAQNCHVSYGSDIVLSEIVIDYGKIIPTPWIIYSYNNFKWSNSASKGTKRHASNLVTMDKWGVYSSRFLFSALSKIEILMYTLWNKPNYKEDIFNFKLVSLLRIFHSSFRFIFFWKLLNISSYVYFQVFSRYFFPNSKITSFLNDFLCKIHFNSRLILVLDSLDSISSLEILINEWLTDNRLSALNLRFKFWLTILSSV